MSSATPRRYEPQLLAETEAQGRCDKGGGKAFRILADDIFGNNQAAEKIAMAVPVTQRPKASDGEKTGTREVPGRLMAVLSPVIEIMKQSIA